MCAAKCLAVVVWMHVRFIAPAPFASNISVNLMCKYSMWGKFVRKILQKIKHHTLTLPAFCRRYTTFVWRYNPRVVMTTDKHAHNSGVITHEWNTTSWLDDEKLLFVKKYIFSSAFNYEWLLQRKKFDILIMMYLDHCFAFGGMNFAAHFHCRHGTILQFNKSITNFLRYIICKRRICRQFSLCHVLFLFVMAKWETLLPLIAFVFFED